MHFAASGGHETCLRILLGVGGAVMAKTNEGVRGAGGGRVRLCRG